ncbi:Nuclear envelope morphology protein 1 [Entomortierella beljakovae]|nr:Nuclear envelope morphology protein 1 [Entomortierella beljakovae]
MLRRSTRFKSRSDLEEIAQSSTPTGTSTTLISLSASLLPSISALSALSASSKHTTTSGSIRSSITSSTLGGYGTDSMAEDGGSGDNSATGGTTLRGNNKLRQRTVRPMSGLGLPGSNGYGGVHSRKKTLVLDLDETLIHSTSRGSRAQGYMVSEWYKLVIFTASMSEYADPVIDWLDQSRTLFDRRYFRQACLYRNGSYLKDLSLINQDLSTVCLLDNSPVSYSLNRENGIPISSWIDDPNDEALLDLLPFLDALRFTEDVRSVLSLRTI